MNPEELKAIAVLHGVDNEALSRLAAALEEIDCAEGRVVFAEGDPGDSMYFIAHGRIRVEKLAQAEGLVRKTLTVLEAGDYFGEMALFDQKPRSASAVAAGPARILRLSKAAFDQIQQRHSVAGMSVLFAMIRTASERIRRLSRQIVVYDEVGKAIGESASLGQLLEVVVYQLCQAALADWGMVLLRAQFSDQVELRGAVNLQLSPAQREALESHAGWWGTALREGWEQLVENTAEQEPFKSAQKGFGVGLETAALLMAPIRIERQSLVLIVLGGRQAGQFDIDDLTLAQGVARQAAQAILNARHREEEAARTRHGRQYVRF